MKRKSPHNNQEAPTLLQSTTAGFAEAQATFEGAPQAVEQVGKWTVGTAGRLVIPSEVRAKLGVQEGDMLVASLVDGELRLLPVAAAVRRAQAMVAHLKPSDGTRVSDALIAERRRDAAGEHS